MEHVTDLDSAGRILSNEELKAFFAFWDFSCAFPSVWHLWLLAVLEAYGFPEGFVCMVRSMYSMCFAYMSRGGALLFLWMIRSGVLQGCPLSGLLLSVTTDPFALAFRRLQSSQNFSRLNVCVRLCADDAGATIAKLAILKSFHAIFMRAEELVSPLKLLNVCWRLCFILTLL